MGQVHTVVLLGRPGTGKTALWLSLAAAFGDTALRLEREEGPTVRVPWPAAAQRFVRSGVRHGVRVARCAGAAPMRRPTWPVSVRLVDGPGLSAGAEDGEGAAALLGESLAADLVLHVVGAEGADGTPIDAALADFARRRGIALERVRLGAPRGRSADGIRAVAPPGPYGRPGVGAAVLATVVRARLGLEPGRSGMAAARWWPQGAARTR